MEEIRMNTKIIYVDDSKAQVSKQFAKNARIFGTMEYKLWREYRKDFPNAVMVLKTIKKNPDKKAYRHMTYENMRLFISQQPTEDRKILMDEFERQLKLSKIQNNPYRFVVAWFEKTFADSEDYFRSIREEKDTSENVIEFKPAM